MSDHWTDEQGPCPCGKGKVVLHVREDDHPWVTNWHREEWTEIECEGCNPKPPPPQQPTERREFSQAQTARLNVISEERSRLHRDFEGICRAVVRREFPSNVYRTKKAEWNRLTELKLFHDSYGVYCRRRHSGVYDVLRLRLKDDWFFERCDTAERARADELVGGIAKLEAEERAIRASPELVIPIAPGS